MGWQDSCPLRVGGMLPCWRLLEANRATASKFHGCTTTAQSGTQSADETGDEAGDERDASAALLPPNASMSAVIARVASVGPPNPTCATIFPPAWRASDWYVASLTDGLMSGH